MGSPSGKYSKGVNTHIPEIEDAFIMDGRGEEEENESERDKFRGLKIISV